MLKDRLSTFVKARSLEVTYNLETVLAIPRTDIVVTSPLDSALPCLRRPALMQGSSDGQSHTLDELLCRVPALTSKKPVEISQFFVCLQKFYILQFVPDHFFFCMSVALGYRQLAQVSGKLYV